MTESTAKALAKQQQLQRLIERSLENFKKLGKNNLTPAKIRSRMASIKDNWSQYLQGHADLLRITSEAAQTAILYFSERHFEATEETYQVTLDYMTECMEELDPPVSLNVSSSVPATRQDTISPSLAHLPSIQLPPFDGKYEEWETFRDRFTALIIHNKELRDFTRMHFLTSCLKGTALDCIREIAVTADNFKVAWAALSARFENKRRLLNVHLSNILNLPSLSRESASDLRTLIDKVTVATISLQNLQRTPEELWHDMLGHIIVQKLDSATRKAWTIKSSDQDEPQSYDTLLRFLTNRSRALEEFSVASTGKPQTKPATLSKVHAATASSIDSSMISCPVCKARHYFNACPSFLRGNLKQRRDLVRQHKRCYNCLSHKHSVSACSSKYSCRICRKRHHSLLHTNSDSEADSAAASEPAIAPPPSDESKPEVQALLASAPSLTRLPVLLATAWVTVSTSSGRSSQVRALLDQGSERTFISANLAQRLRARRARMPVTVSAIGGVNAGTISHAVQIFISPRAGSTRPVTTMALILKNLTSYAPQRFTNLATLSHLHNLSLADEDPTSSEPIHLIIGADLYTEVILDGLRKGRAGEPIAQNSIFGWIVSGPIRINSLSMRPSPRISVHHCAQESSLDEDLKRFWETEEPPRRPIPSQEDERCDQHFRETHSRTSTGRYIVRLPFKRGPPIEIGESRSRAERLLASLFRRFHVDSDRAKEYVAFLTEYERLGHMRQASLSDHSSDQQVFIPHHPVFRADSATTRLRVVFNASCLTSNGTSLNDHLLCGPKLQADLNAVILRWRTFKFVYAADIAKMYRQVLVDARDLNYQKILWKSENADAPTEYQLTTVTYGMTCAPYLALRVIQQLEKDEGPHFPRSRSILRDNLYVDDVLFGGDDIESLRQRRRDLCTLLRRGGFELRKWASNSAALLDGIDPADHGLACEKALASDEKLKILGIAWNPARDAFQFRVSLSDKAPQSKRSILSAIAKFFDPLGWITPVIITAKIFMQNMWREKLTWDATLPPTLLVRWELIYSRLSKLNGLKIPRWTGLGPETHRAELHGFADASSAAFAAVVYLRIVSQSGDVTVTLLTAKSRVAPLKPLSIPRLELSAAVLLAQILEFVRNVRPLSTAPCFCWTDSTVVLAWLAQHPSRWKMFVANRVAEIQTRLPNIQWQHVATDENPADCASRGLLGDEILNHTLWWQGPSWLRVSQDHWPSSIPGPPPNVQLEAKIASLQSSQIHEQCLLASRYSSWPKLIRVTAYLFRFISRCRDKAAKRDREIAGASLSGSEYNSSQMFWIKRIQSELFSKEIHALENARAISQKSDLLSLRPFLDARGILRVGGRLRNAPIPFTQRCPIVLASHYLVRLLIAHLHTSSLHAGLQLLLSTLRRHYWVIRSRSIAKSIIHRCMVCARERAAAPSHLMGDLPSERVTVPPRVFYHCGVDYAGPVFTRASAGRGITARKAYIALFICLATRAIHLELVSDCSTPAFVNAFSRFCSRRGMPASMYSDNGTTFVGADRELATAYKTALRDPNFLNKTSADNITWHFIPPSAPHFGGLWEAGVRSVKYHLRRVLGKHTLTFEEFTTLLCKIEACLNSRPIAPLSDTLDDYDPLTPGHFLIGSAVTMHPEPSVFEVQENRLTRWQLVSHITEKFWKLWQNDYINTLQQRTKWRTDQTPIKIGQIVLIRNPNLPPCKWEIGRVQQTHPGADGVTRVVTVKTALSVYKRPIGKLCVLPVEREPNGV